MALVFLLTAWMQRATAQSNSESDLKAMFIYNFVKYVEWPPSGGSSFRIGVVGDSPVSDASSILRLMLSTRRRSAGT